MTNMQGCLICGSTDWSTINIDFATGFAFCDKHNRMAKDEYRSLIGEEGLSKWLRSIANIIDKEEELYGAKRINGK